MHLKRSLIRRIHFRQIVIILIIVIAIVLVLSTSFYANQYIEQILSNKDIITDNNNEINGKGSITGSEKCILDLRVFFHSFLS